MQLYQVKPQTSSGGISLFKSNSGVPLHPCSLCIRVFGIHGCAWSLTPESNWTEALATTRLKHFFIHTLFFLRGRTLQHLSKLYQNPCPWIQAWHSARNCTNHPSKSKLTLPACSSGTDVDVFVFHLKPIWYFQTCWLHVAGSPQHQTLYLS